MKIPYEIIEKIMLYVDFDKCVAVLENTNFSCMIHKIYSENRYYIDFDIEHALLHFNSIKWLYRNCDVYYSRKLILDTIKYCSLKDIKWMISEVKQCNDIYLIDHASKNGNLKVIKFLNHIGYNLASSESVENCITHGYPDILWYLYQKNNSLYNKSHIFLAEYCKQKEIINIIKKYENIKNIFEKWLFDNKNLYDEFNDKNLFL
jgi:hypothetical protein